MIKIMKKTAAFFLSSLLVISFVGLLTARAATPTIQPRWNYVNSIYTNCNIDGNNADWQANFSIYKTGYKSKMTVNVQQSKDQKSWSNIHTTSYTWSTTGRHILSGSQKNVASGYYYRTHVVVQILSGSTVLETVTLDSTPVRH